MIRLFLPPGTFSSEKVIISGEKAHHLNTVLRIKSGEFISVFDGLGNRYIYKVLKVHKKDVIAEKITKEQYSTESPLQVTIAQGIPKSEKMDIIIQKSTELGVRRLIPLITERSQVRHAEKTMRWRKIAISASQQSGREIIPEIEEPVEFNEFINRQGIFKGIIFFEEEKHGNLKKILAGLKDESLAPSPFPLPSGERVKVKGDVILLIGPEGGFSEKEVNQAVQKGFIMASLGPRILRTETAAITALSIIQYELGDIG